MRMTVINASDAANCHCKITATAMGIVRGHILFGEALLTLERPTTHPPVTIAQRSVSEHLISNLDLTLNPTLIINLRK